ncbi:Phosphatidylinositol phosphatase PTPRQ [Larimichthys crocea]|uniref:Uncharacterized protein n=1 Tax=Larimichthys crocea TaxID=215358 RepID=A0ACD3QFY9_LARCR|nr:Phosphatidylinositol phosphatase PTPRQ [Larimichthys crocea]
MSSRQERIVGMNNISKLSETSGLQSCTAVIGGLESYRKYRVEVFTITQHGIESCGQTPLTVQTEMRAPGGLVVMSTAGNLTVCWTSPHDDPPDGYHVTSQPLIYATPTSLWINQTNPANVTVRMMIRVFGHIIPVLQVQKVFSQSATFSSLAPGRLYHFAVRTEKDSFTDSSPVTINITAVPEVPQEVALSEEVVTSVFVNWRQPLGQVEGYKLVFGLQSMDRKSWIEVLVQGTSYEIKDLIPGSDYGISIQSVLGSDTSQAFHREFSTRPAGVCALRLNNMNSSSVTVSWDSAFGDFDFHRVTVTNNSVTNTHTIPKEEQAAVVTGLVDGCSYNVSAERVRGVTAGSAAFLAVTTVPARVQGVRVMNVSPHAFSLRWEEAAGCVDHYQVNLQPDQGNVTVHPALDGYIQADVVNVSPGTQYTATVTAVSSSSSNISPGVSRMINTNLSVPGPPLDLEGTPVGSNGILLSWTMPPDADIDGYVIRYKEVCPYPDPAFTRVTKYLDIPEILITDFTSGSTYHIQVAALSQGEIGAFSRSLYIKTAESPPGLVTNLTAVALNRSFVMLTWFLPRHINGLITKFAVKAKNYQAGQVRILEVNAEEIMSVALPHCNDAADILSRATLSPLEITASSPPITLSAVPPAASWSVPISVGVDQLQPFTSYLFEVSAFTSDGEGQVASTMARTAESGYIYENSTSETRFSFTGLNPYTRYTVAVRAKAVGEVGPSADMDVITPAEAPSAVQDLVAVAEDSVSVLVSWKSPAEPNGMITQYRLQVLVDEILLQDITLTAEVNTTDSNEDETPPPGVHENSGRRKRDAELDLVTSPPTFTATISDRTLPTSVTASNPTHSTNQITNTDAQPAADSTVTEKPSTSHTSASHSNSTDIQSTDSTVFETSALSLTSVPPATLPPWLMGKTHAGDVSSGTSASALTPVPSSVLDVSYQNISSTSILVSWVPPLNPNGRITHYTVYGLKLHTNEALTWATNATDILITDLDKYTGYKLRVAASTAVGESSLSEEDDIFVLTLEDEPESPPENLTVDGTTPSTTTLTWSAPDKANGVIQYYEVMYENESYSAVMNTSSNRIALINLKPFSYYNVSVRAYTRYGHGNQTSDTLYLLSGEDVPGSPPYGVTFESVSPSEVNVTWQPPLVPNGVITHYSLELWNSSHYLNLTSPTNYIHITHLRKYAHYRVMVQAHTRVGPGNYSSEPLNITTLEDVPSDSVRNLTAQNFTSTAIIVSWDPPLQPNGRPYYLLTLQEAGVPPNVSNQGTPCQQDHQVPSSAPLLVSTRNVSSSSIAVVWQRPLEANGEITEYILTLFGPGGSNITHTNNTSLILTNLLPYTAYNLSITAATRKGSGPYLMLQLHTDEGGPMSPPRNLIIYNHTAVSVWLSWEPPLEPNGVVIQYGFRIRDLITHTVTHRNSSGPLTTEYLSGFRPHSSYEISVYSFTRVGHGNQFSSPVTFTTNESVSDAVGNLSCSGVSWDSVQLSWELPANPNGQIIFYEILSEGDMQSYTHQAYTPEYVGVWALTRPGVCAHCCCSELCRTRRQHELYCFHSL